ncbi:MAG TPA: 3-phosphoshikimate 1-carboxyvinyltransferase [Hyphomonadaceae bacterium]|nr:3-phosphoshikimate 1-carboxyvinyltransferase [Hyphomonadaceae bacterium]
MRATSRPVPRIKGTIRAPGDKSCSHRAVMMAAVAEGATTVTGLLEGEDVLNTAKAVKALGAGVERLGPGQWRITGVGARGFQTPAGDLDFGNSGTGARLMMGLVGGHDVTARFTGDASLSSRPMERVLKPLREMGVKAETAPGGRLPARITGGKLKAIRYAPPEASAQVKSAILLAGLCAEGVTIVEEKEATRDHTERMLAAFGVHVGVETRTGAGPAVSLRGGQALKGGFAAAVAGDPSSAAFAIAAALIAGGGAGGGADEGEATVAAMLDNRTRTGFIDAAREMGGEIHTEEDGKATGEDTIRVIARASRLKAITLDPALVPSMIDELPVFAVLAAFADGRTKVTGAAELRVKESDRIKAICAMLSVNGVEVEELPDGFIVTGKGARGASSGVPGGGAVETRHDHRIAMSALVMGTAARQPVSVDDIAMIATSYPDFFDHMAALGADLQRAR